MKKTMNLALCLFFAILCLVVTSCSPAKTQGSLWDTATYKEDITLGEGAKEVTVSVKAEEKAVVFTLHTNAETLGDALLEQALIAGAEGAYGLYVKVVNGMEADYDKNQTYWSLMQNDAPLMTGVDSTNISGGERFELVCVR